MESEKKWEKKHKERFPPSDGCTRMFSYVRSCLEDSRESTSQKRSILFFSLCLFKAKTYIGLGMG